ncbi:MAG: hypothetical protein K0S81_1855 [Rhodospirillales bacterium]|nr:hypothetical protein [Rhodospirillales bacterium]
MSAVDRAAHIAAARLSERLPGAGSDVQTILSGILRSADLAVVVGASFVPIGSGMAAWPCRASI